MLLAIEELHAAVMIAGLPSISVRWTDPSAVPANGEDHLLALRAERLFRKITDITSMGLGPQPASLAEISAPPDPDAYLVEGFIRPGTTVMLTGPPSAAKSWASRQLAISAGCGQKTFLERYALPRRLSVLVVDEDNGEREEYRREDLLLSAMGLKRADATQVHRISLAGVMLDQPMWQAWLRAQIEALRLDLLVLDPISEMHGGKELREDPPFRALLGFLKRLKVDFPALATLLVHHTRKPSSADRAATRSVDDVRGQWGQTPDVVALMWPLGEQRMSWELYKRVPHSKLILEQKESGALHTVVDETSARSKQVSTDDRVLGAIESGAQAWDEVMHGTGLSKASIFRAVKRLRMARLITQHEPYAVVDDPTEDPIA
jgi:hypothetical protein